MTSVSSGTFRGLALLFAGFPLICMAQDATAIATASPSPHTLVAPPCAQSCVLSSQQVQNNCAETDQACLCQQSSIIQAAISSCLDGTKACSEADKQQAVAYYPQFCASYGLSNDGTQAVTGANGIITAAGVAPTQVSGRPASSLVLTNTADSLTPTETSTIKTSGDHSSTGLSVPAILGITLGAFLVVVGVAAVLVYAHVRRRQSKRRTRVDFLASELGGHFAEQDPPTIARPPRSQSIQSHFVVQPTPPEKPAKDFDFGLAISRCSTLVSVAPPPPAKVCDTSKELPDIRASAYHVEQAVSGQGGDQGGHERSVPVKKSSRTSSILEYVGSRGKRLRASLMKPIPTTTSSKTSQVGTRARNHDHDLEKDEFDGSNRI